jgi:ATP-binding cassette subfamily B (MDR/TAP) protein 1
MSSDEKEKPSPSPNWLKPKQPEKQESPSVTSAGDQTAVEVKVPKPVADDLKPVSLFGLFKSVLIIVPFHRRFFKPSSPRFSTRTEITINALSIITAVAAGASQVCFICHIRHVPTNGCFR